MCIRESKKAETHVTSTTHHRTIEKLNDDPTQRRVAEMLGLEFLRPRGQCEDANIRMLAISKPAHARHFVLASRFQILRVSHFGKNKEHTTYRQTSF